MRRIVLETDRVQLAIARIVELEGRIRFPADIWVHHPIQLVKEAEQQVSRTCCTICGRTGTPLEQHHVAGRVNFHDTVTLCRVSTSTTNDRRQVRCHDEITDIYQPKWIHSQRSPLECYFLGWSDVFHLLWRKTRRRYFYELSKVFALNARYAK